MKVNNNNVTGSVGPSKATFVLHIGEPVQQLDIKQQLYSAEADLESTEKFFQSITKPLKNN